MNFEKTFKENRQRLLNLASINSLKCENMISSEEFYSQGCEVFIKCFNNYDSKKAQFNTYFISSCKWTFNNMIVKETIRQIGKVSTKGIHIDNGDQEHRISFMDRLSKLSNDAVEVVMLVLKTPSDFVDDLSRSTIRKFFIKQWGGEGGQQRVTFAFNEIKNTLKEVN